MANLTDKEKDRVVESKLLEGVREIGVLWLALAPLDYTVGGKLTLVGLIVWVILGAVLLVAASFAERRLH